VLVFQGHLEKGLAELQEARDRFLELNKPDRAKDIESDCKELEVAIAEINEEVYA